MIPDNFHKLRSEYYEQKDPILVWRQTPRKWRDKFISTLHLVYSLLREVHPQLVLFPMRGAAPMHYALDAINRNQVESLSYHEISLPIGTSILPDNLYTQKSVRNYASRDELQQLQARFPRNLPIPSNADTWVKWEIIRSYLDLYGDTYGFDHLECVVMIDEMQNGGTATKAAYLIDSYLESLRVKKPKLDFHVIAVQDERVFQHAHHSRSLLFQHLVNQENPAAQRIQVYEFHTPLFTVDNAPLLPMIVTLKEMPLANRFQLVENDIMERYFRELITTDP